MRCSLIRWDLACATQIKVCGAENVGSRLGLGLYKDGWKRRGSSDLPRASPSHNDTRNEVETELWWEILHRLPQPAHSNTTFILLPFSHSQQAALGQEGLGEQLLNEKI